MMAGSRHLLLAGVTMTLAACSVRDRETADLSVLGAAKPAASVGETVANNEIRLETVAEPPVRQSAADGDRFAALLPVGTAAETGATGMEAARRATQGFSLANIALSTARPDLMAEWYRNALGFEIRDRAPGVNGVSTFIIQREGVSIDLIRVPHQRPLEPPLPPPDFLRIRGLRNLVFWVDDQAAANAHLKNMGVPLLWESREVEGIGTAITAFRDPDGNLIALWERRPPAREASEARQPSAFAER